MTKLPISLCMIVKNEVEMLEQCLMAAMPLVRQIIIVDTGSTDKTIEVAESMGAEVHQYKWNDNFASARNYSLSFAKEKWIMVLDADEIIDFFFGVRPFKKINDSAISSLEVTIHNLNDRGPVQTFNLIRLFRNSDAIKFANAIHEGVAASVAEFNRKKGKITAISGIQVKHYGYLQDKLAAKGERNLKLIRKILKEKPDYLYFLMKEYEELEKLGRTEECNERIKNALNVLSDMKAEEYKILPFSPMISVNYVQLLLDEQKWQEVISEADTWLQKFENEPWLLYMRSLAQLHTGQLDLAREGFRQCLASGPLPKDYFVDPGINSWLVQQALGEIAISQNKMDEAINHFKDALKSNANYLPAWIKLFDVYVAGNDAKEAMKVIIAVLAKEENNVWALLNGANVLLAMGIKDKALAWCEKVLNVSPGLPEAENLLIKIKGNEYSL